MAVNLEASEPVTFTARDEHRTRDSDVSSQSSVVGVRMTRFLDDGQRNRASRFNVWCHILEFRDTNLQQHFCNLKEEEEKKN